MTMSVFLQFDCLIQNETARKAMENYVGFLKKAFEQYRSLWEDYIKLQEKHKHCNVDFPSKVRTDKHYIKTNDLTPQRQLNNHCGIQENNSSPLLELDSLYLHNLNFDSDVNTDFASLHESPRKYTGNNISSPLRSPIFPRTCLRTCSTSAKKPVKSPKTATMCNDSASGIKTNRSFEKIPSKYNQKPQISTTHHVETFFLPDGRNLKQSRLMFEPVKHEEKKISSDIDKFKSITIMQETVQIPINISEAKTSVTMKCNDRTANETFTEDVIEISPQKNTKFKGRHRLKLKKKNPTKYIIKGSPNKSLNKSHGSGLNIVAKIPMNDVDSVSYPLSKYIAVGNDISSGNSNTDNKLKDNINISDFSLAQRCNEENVKIMKSINVQMKEQSITSLKAQFAKNASDEDETFYLPAEQAASIKKDDLNDFNLYDTENTPPVKRTLLNEFDALPKKKKDDRESYLNMQCKTDRAKLNGWDCWECKEYYKNLSLSKEELQKRKNQCSRHRYRYERPNTPEGFWDPEFPETFAYTFQGSKS